MREAAAIAVSLRPWQVHAVERLHEALKAAGSRACLVAPPGAGKTICALAAAADLPVPIEVRVPTTALVTQWQARIAAVWRELGPGGAHAETSAPPIRVATYASGLPFAEGALVLLDEAHHLTSAWGRAAAAHLTPQHRVLGLTATPPHDAPGWDQFVDLVGAEPIEIPAPPLVRDGQLCPYQDLVWPMLVDLEDVAPLRAVDLALADLEAEVGSRFRVWEALKLSEELWTLTEARFSGESGLLVALCRLRTARGAALPADLPVDEELTAPPTLHDRALALHSFDPHDARIAAGLRAAGFRIRASGPALQDDVAWRTLAGSGARLRGALEVLAVESRARGDQLRALLVCDRDVESERLSAREVLRGLVSDPRSRHLNPVLVTGACFWFDGDLGPRLAGRLPELPWTKREDHYEVDVSGWGTGERVALATRLLEEGTSQCLVGTRHLLGEGWDCPAVNVVVDLTGVVASVTVNQVRGRGLRPDPHDVSKVASLWEVLAVAPGLPDGDRMLQELQRRHRHTFGVDAAGAIRAGAARIDPLLAGGLGGLLPELEGLRTRAAANAGNAATVASRWAVGRDYRDVKLWRTIGTASAAGPRTRVAAPPETPKPKPTSVQARLARAKGWTDGLAATASLTGALTLAGAAAFGLPWQALLAAGALGGSGVGFAHQRARAHATRSHRRETAILRALHLALIREEPGYGPLRLDGDRAWVDSPELAERFALAVAELLGPVRAPRYLLIEADGQAWPVPTELAARRDLADRLATAWGEEVGPATAVYARSTEGRLLLRELWRGGASRSHGVEVVEEWE